MDGPQHGDEEYGDAYPAREGVPGTGEPIPSVPIGALALAMATPATLLARPIRR